MLLESEARYKRYPLITIFVRHSADCKYAGDKFEKRCRCRKHLRSTQNGKQFRRKTGTRSWGEAEEHKRRLEDQLARTPAPESTGQTMQEAVDIFLADKKLQVVTDNVLGKYTRELVRLCTSCEGAGVYTVRASTVS